MKNCKRLMSVTIAAVLMTGCAPKMQLVKDVTPEQLAKDNAECNLEAMKAVIGLSESIFLEVERNKAISYCLQSKGYAYQQKPNEGTDKQKAVMDRYKRANAINNEKYKIINEHIANDCRPKDDKGYIDCLNESRTDLLRFAVFPDIVTKMSIEEEEFKQQLLRKEITRKEFKEYANKSNEPFIKQWKDRIDSDVKAGIYTGNSIY